MSGRLFCIAIVLASAISGATPAFAQSWKPSKNVEFIVGAGSGGGNDRTARVVQKIMQERALIPTPMVVVNKPGAGGVIAQDYLNTHAGDGHFLMITNPALLTNQLTGVGAAKYTDITPIAQLFTEYVMLFVKADGALTSGKVIIERLRKDPGALSIAVSHGTGAGTHIVTALVMKAAGIDSRMLRVVSYVTYLNSRESRKFLDQEYYQLKRILNDLGLAN